MPDVTYLDAATDELGMGGLDVGDDQAASGRAGSGGREPQAERDRGPGAGGRELHDPEAVHRGDVIIEPPTQVIVELLGPVNVGHGNDLHLELHVDLPDVHLAAWVV